MLDKYPSLRIAGTAEFVDVGGTGDDIRVVNR